MLLFENKLLIKDYFPLINKPFIVTFLNFDQLIYVYKLIL